MILHDLTPGMHPRRVRIFIAEKGLSIERREVDAAGGANTTPEFLRLNPLGSRTRRRQRHCRVPGDLSLFGGLAPAATIDGADTSGLGPNRDVDLTHGLGAFTNDR
jgi:hypothetical protein